jgi:6-pyruvoyltetrahydropterin/6-carboxytetrahydropterin synthase
MFYIGKTFTFDASHRLDHLPDDHKCSRLHGHTYRVEVGLSARSVAAPEGWVYDYGDLKAFKEWIDNNLDHRHLNDFMLQEFGEPQIPSTAENLAYALYHKLFQILSIPGNVSVDYVRVCETPNTFAEYREP